jgi:hypothetical protein
MQLDQFPRRALTHGAPVEPAQLPPEPVAGEDLPAEEEVGDDIALHRQRQILLDRADPGRGRLRRAGEHRRLPIDGHVATRRLLHPGDRIANRYTFSAVFGRDLTDPARRAAQRLMLGDLVVSYLTNG